MNKYIDAEKLYEKVDALMAHYAKAEEEIDKYVDVETAIFYQGKWKMCSEIINLITSLQQEQPETDGDDGKFVKILVRKEFAKQFQRLGDEILDGQSSFIRAMNQQELPEVDFEKELKNEKAKLLDAFGPMNGEQSLAIKNFARHFVELGLKSLK